jgi:TRAP-type transport system small permease protein
MLRFVDKLAGGLRSTAETITWSLAGLLVVIVTTNVFARYVLQIGIMWSEEVSRLAFVWVVFLGSYVALCRKGHMAIGLLIKRVPPRAQVTMLLVGRILTLAFLACLTWAGIELVRMTLQFGRTSPILGISAAWGYVAVPVASALMFVEVLREVLASEPLPREEGDDVPVPAEPA